MAWEVARQRGSHIILTKPGHIATLSVPNHPQVARASVAQGSSFKPALRLFKIFCLLSSGLKSNLRGIRDERRGLMRTARKEMERPQGYNSNPALHVLSL
jgi:hypothetical protein